MNYREFCQTAPDLPVFMQPWFLDAACGEGAWQCVLVHKQNRAVAALPFFVKKKWAWQYVAMPPLVKMLGPYVLPEFRTLRHEPSILQELLEQLPPLAAFEQDCHYNLTNWLPFYWHGFRQTTRYSYVLDINNLDIVWAGIAADYRNNKMKKADAQVSLQVGGDLAEFYRIHNLSFERQGLEAPVDFAFLQKIDAALGANQAREVFFAVDRQTGKTHSAAYLIWDKTSAYLLMAGDDPALRDSGAGIWLLWETIQYAHNVLNVDTYDFLGSMIKPIERVRRSFGAIQRPYFRLQREWSPLFRAGKILLR